jgi:sulfatase maturation enzyme AslB (radical SAM superfamily)
MMTEINEFYKDGYNRTQSCELFSAGWCNLNCEYCYIPKTAFLKDVHKGIIEKIRNGEYIENIKKTFGDSLINISHWGTEPTLTVTEFKDFYKKAVEYFPNLKEIFLSSNFMTNPNNLITFLNETLPQTKKLDVRIQASLDGPKWITDVNRVGGSTNIIIKNVEKFLKGLDTIHDVRLHIKATIAEDQLIMLADYDKIKEYYEFMDGVLSGWMSIRSDVTFQLSADPTLVVPWDYTSEHGKKFYELCLNQIRLRKEEIYKAIRPPEIFYFTRFLEKAPFYREFYVKSHMFSCSAGDGQIGFGGSKADTIQSCHRSYYIDYPEYDKEMAGLENDPLSQHGYEQGCGDILKDLTSSNMNNKKHLLKFLYANRGYHDFSKHQIASSVAVIKELAMCGQVSKVYENWRWAELLAQFCFNYSCHLDNIMIASAFELQCPSYFRLFGNGVFELILKEYREMVNEWNK